MSLSHLPIKLYISIASLFLCPLPGPTLGWAFLVYLIPKRLELVLGQVHYRPRLFVKLSRLGPGLLPLNRAEMAAAKRAA